MGSHGTSPSGGYHRAPMSESPRLDVMVLGIVSISCLCLVLVPQVLHNYRRKSVEGLSSLTILGWHLACALVTGYLVANNEVIMVICAFAMQTATFVLIETQFILYGRNSESADSDDHVGSETISDREHIRRASAMLLMSSLVSACTVAGSWWICTTGSSLLGLFIGGVVPSLLFGVGYILQIFEIVQSGSGDGISLGLIALDSSGCVCGMATVLITSGDVGAVAVFLVNIMFHAVLASMIWIYPGPSSKSASPGGNASEPDAEAVKEVVEEALSSSSDGPVDGPAAPGLETLFYNKASLATGNGRVHDGDGTARQRPAHVRQCCSPYPMRA